MSYRQKLKCPLTGLEVERFENDKSASHYYETIITGKIKFTDVAFDKCESLSKEQKDILIKLCKRENDRGNSPFEISSSLIEQIKNNEID